MSLNSVSQRENSTYSRIQLSISNLAQNLHNILHELVPYLEIVVPHEGEGSRSMGQPGCYESLEADCSCAQPLTTDDFAQDSYYNNFASFRFDWLVTSGQASTTADGIICHIHSCSLCQGANMGRKIRRVAVDRNHPGRSQVVQNCR